MGTPLQLFDVIDYLRSIFYALHVGVVIIIIVVFIVVYIVCNLHYVTFTRTSRCFCNFITMLITW